MAFISKIQGNSNLYDGLVAWWTMDGKNSIWTSNTAGTIIDSSGNGRVGTFTNMNRAASCAMGRIGQSIKFDGSDDYIQVAHNASLSVSAASFLSISFWANPAAIETRGLIGKQSSASGFDGYTIGYTALGKLVIALNGIGTFSATSTITAFFLNKWTHIVVIMKAASSILGYANNQIIINTTDSGATSISETTPFRIGMGYHESDSNFDGMIDDVRVYNRQLSVGEINQLYNLSFTKLRGIFPNTNIRSL